MAGISGSGTGTLVQAGVGAGVPWASLHWRVHSFGATPVKE